jgi:hypothetical protein
VWCHSWPAAWTMHIPAMSYKWHICLNFAKWTANPLKEISSTIMIADLLPAWRSSYPHFNTHIMRLSEWPCPGWWASRGIILNLPKPLPNLPPLINIHVVTWQTLHMNERRAHEITTSEFLLQQDMLIVLHFPWWNGPGFASKLMADILNDHFKLHTLYNVTTS